MSMLQYFFEDVSMMANPQENGQLFHGLKIMEADPEYLEKIGHYPVISLSLKSAKQATFSSAYYKLCEELWREFDRHSYVLDTLTGIKYEQYLAFLNQNASEDAYSGALRFLSEVLYSYHGVPTIILIDEYDAPLENSYFCGFYNEIWSNTSSNSIIKELVEHATMEQREEIERLIGGLTIEKQLHEDITYDDIHQNETDEYFANFNFKPAEGYTYTAGDEVKLVCLNDGYTVYWDAATGTFRLQSAN